MNVNALKPVGGYREGDATVLGTAYSHLGSETKRALRRMIPLIRGEMEAQLPDEPSFVTRKVNGELGVLIYTDGAAALVNSGNIARADLPVLLEAAELLKRAGVQSATLSCELFALVDGRETVAAVQRNLKERPEQLHLAVFDIQEIDGAAHDGDYGATHDRIRELFAGGNLVAPVEMTKVETRAALPAVFEDFVGAHGAEGIVIRTRTGLTYKVKPLFSLDCAVLAFTSTVDPEGEKIRNLLFGLQEQDGSYRIIGHGGNGLSSDERHKLHKELSAAPAASGYLETDGEGLAFRFVEPRLVLELNCQDINIETISGPIDNPLIRFDDDGSKEPRWHQADLVSGISLTHPVVQRLRRDKSASGDDVGVQQVGAHIPEAEAAQTLQTPSTLLSREVFVKRSKNKLMVRKFLIYRTNKGDGKHFLDYLFFYTDFSSSRKEPLKTEIRISNSRDQIESIFSEYKTEYVKKGWEPVGVKQ